MTVARTKTDGTVGSYYTGTGIADELAAQVVAMAPRRGVLDPTCGDGRLLDAVRLAGYTGPLYGMDADPVAVAACRAKGYDATVGDSLFDDVPDADVWICNPPYLGGLKISGVLGQDYKKRLIAQWGKAGTADYCAYWLRRADDLPRVRAVVGVYTNTIAQGDTRRFGLRHLLAESEGFWEITWAWKRRRWEGDKAAVIVSLITLLRRCILAEDDRAYAHLFEPAWSWKGCRAGPWDQTGPYEWVRYGAATVERVYDPSARTSLLYPYQWRARGSEDGWTPCTSPEEGMREADAALVSAGWILEGGTP